MNRWMGDFLKTGMGRLMDESRDMLAQEDEIYRNNRNDEDELEHRYKSLDLSRDQKMIVNQYIACIASVNHR